MPAEQWEHREYPISDKARKEDCGGWPVHEIEEFINGLQPRPDGIRGHLGQPSKSDCDLALHLYVRKGDAAGIVYEATSSAATPDKIEQAVKNHHPIVPLGNKMCIIKQADKVGKKFFTGEGAPKVWWVRWVKERPDEDRPGTNAKVRDHFAMWDPDWMRGGTPTNEVGFSFPPHFGDGYWKDEITEGTFKENEGYVEAFIPVDAKSRRKGYVLEIRKDENVAPHLNRIRCEVKRQRIESGREEPGEYGAEEEG